MPRFRSRVRNAGKYSGEEATGAAQTRHAYRYASLLFCPFHSEEVKCSGLGIYELEEGKKAQRTFFGPVENRGARIVRLRLRWVLEKLQ